MGDPAVAVPRGVQRAGTDRGHALGVLARRGRVWASREVLYRWAHFIVGCLIALLGSVALSAALAVPADHLRGRATLSWACFATGTWSPCTARASPRTFGSRCSRRGRRGREDVHNTHVDDDWATSRRDGPASDDEGNPNDVAGSREGGRGDETCRLPPARDWREADD